MSEKQNNNLEVFCVLFCFVLFKPPLGREELA